MRGRFDYVDLPKRALNFISRFNDRFCRLLRGVTGIILGLICLILFYSVLMRYVLNSPITWSEDAAKILMVWMVLLGAPVGLRVGSHIAIDMMLTNLPRIPAKIVQILSVLLIVFVAWIFLSYGWSFSMKGMRRIVPSMEWLKFGFAYLAMPLGYAFLLPICLEQILLILLGKSLKNPTEKERE